MTTLSTAVSTGNNDEHFILFLYVGTGIYRPLALGFGTGLGFGVGWLTPGIFCFFFFLELEGTDGRPSRFYWNR